MDITAFFGLDTWMHLLHIVGVIVAVGGVVSTDMMSAVFHFKPKMALTLARISIILSGQIWLGFMILSITGLFLFLPRPWLSTDPLFQVKMVLVLIVFLNGILLNIYAGPRFRKLAPEWKERTPAVRKFEKISALMTVISMFGWWSIVIMGYFLVQG
jgi:hypothetical protein